MKAKINKENCVGCGACQAIVPEIFNINDNGLSEVIVDKIPENLEDGFLDAKEACPTGAIEED